MFLLNNLKFNPDIQRIIGDTQYPAGWFRDPLERTKIGVIEVPDPVRPDDNFFTYVENPNGSYTATPRTIADLAERHAAAKAAFVIQVKAEAGAITQKILSGLGSEYELAEKEALAYKAAGYPEKPIPGSVQSEINSKAAKGITITATIACNTILTMATSWRIAQAALRDKRLTTTSAAEVAVDTMTLDNLKSQWSTFISAIEDSVK